MGEKIFQIPDFERELDAIVDAGVSEDATTHYMCKLTWERPTTTPVCFFFQRSVRLACLDEISRLLNSTTVTQATPNPLSSFSLLTSANVIITPSPTPLALLQSSSMDRPLLASRHCTPIPFLVHTFSWPSRPHSFFTPQRQDPFTTLARPLLVMPFV